MIKALKALRLLSDTLRMGFTVKVVEYDHTAMDEVWSKHFHAWQAQG